MKRVFSALFLPIAFSVLLAWGKSALADSNGDGLIWPSPRLIHGSAVILKVQGDYANVFNITRMSRNTADPFRGEAYSAGDTPIRIDAPRDAFLLAISVDA